MTKTMVQKGVLCNPIKWSCRFNKEDLTEETGRGEIIFYKLDLFTHWIFVRHT